MGLGDLLGRWRMKEPTDGTAEVVWCSPRPFGEKGECTMRLIARAERVAPVTIEHRERKVPAAIWPSPGMTLPITLDRARPERVKVRWDDVRPAAATSALHTSAAVSHAHVETRVEPAVAGGQPHVEVTSLALDSLAQISDEQRAQLSRFGFDIDSFAASLRGGNAMQGFAQFFTGDLGERMRKLQQAADLHAQGALTDEELAEQARRILGA